MIEYSSMTEEDESLSVFSKNVKRKEEENVAVEKVEEGREPFIQKHPGLQFNYEGMKTFSWIVGLIVILVFILVRWVISLFPEIRHEIIESAAYTLYYSKQLTFLWKFCNTTTFECSWCPPGWIEHDWRCYLIPNYTATWEQAQEMCNQCMGQLPIVSNAKDQIHLTRMAVDYKKQDDQVEGVWIGLTDTELEGTFTWVDGKNLTLKNAFWQPQSPKKGGTHGDCVAIVPQINSIHSKWYYTWDNIICHDERHFICEIPLFPLEVEKFLSFYENLEIESLVVAGL